MLRRVLIACGVVAAVAYFLALAQAIHDDNYPDSNPFLLPALLGFGVIVGPCFLLGFFVGAGVVILGRRRMRGSKPGT
jgi:hypothetical protein